MVPVFYISSERSGTNFFRNLINANSKAFFPHNPGIFSEFKNIAKNYKSKEEFVFDVVGLIRFNHDPWDFIPEEEEIIKRLNKIDALEIKKVIYEICEEHYNVNVVGFKGIEFCKVIPDIYITFKDPKFIYQYRDPRDCAASWFTISSGPKHVYHAAIRWNEEQEMVKNVSAELKTKGDIFSFSYENLVQNTPDLLHQICNFLGLNFEEKMLESYKSREAKKSSTMHKAWNNLAKPVMTNNFNKFEKLLSVEQIEIIERVCYKNMDRLGYELKNKTFLENEPTPFSVSEIEMFNRLNEENRKENFVTAERNYRKERKDNYRKCLHQKFSSVK